MTLHSPEDFAGFAPVFREPDGRPQPLDSLTYSLKEVIKIEQLFRQKGIPGITFKDTAASEKNFRIFTPGYSHIHIATHSQISENAPWNSALFLNGGNHSPGVQDQDDGLLHLDEISNLKLTHPW